MTNFRGSHFYEHHKRQERLRRNSTCFVPSYLFLFVFCHLIFILSFLASFHLHSSNPTLQVLSWQQRPLSRRNAATRDAPFLREIRQARDAPFVREIAPLNFISRSNTVDIKTQLQVFDQICLSLQTDVTTQPTDTIRLHHNGQSSHLTGAALGPLHTLLPPSDPTGTATASFAVLGPSVVNVVNAVDIYVLPQKG